jgi:hypothetical protein
MLPSTLPQHQICLLQGIEMVRHAWFGHMEMLGNLACRHIPLPKQAQDLPSIGIRQSFECIIQRMSPHSIYRFRLYSNYLIKCNPLPNLLYTAKSSSTRRSLFERSFLERYALFFPDDKLCQQPKPPEFSGGFGFSMVQPAEESSGYPFSQ